MRRPAAGEKAAIHRFFRCRERAPRGADACSSGLSAGAAARIVHRFGGGVYVCPLQSIVLAGGSGRRLASLTGRHPGRSLPKQYCSFGRPHTLLQETLARLAPLTPPDRTTVVVRDEHLAVASEQLAAFAGVSILGQPSDRGTGSGLLRGLVHAFGMDPDAPVLVTPADHGIRDHDAYVRGIVTAREACDLAHAILLGVEADAPRTDYGWIAPGAEIAPGVRRIAAFLEKPALPEAEALAASGGLFSTMVLVARTRSLLRLFERARPGLTALFEPLATLPPLSRALHLKRVYALLGPCDFSRDILGSAEDLAVVRWPADVGWTDLGTPERLAAWLGCDRSDLVRHGAQLPVALG